jgi:phospholipid/cholesterol/gamma-HCH transport system substrate-binding protein
VSAFRVGLVVLIVTAAGTYLGFTKDVPFVGDPWEVQAVFEDSSGLRPGSPVRIAGVEVGEVRKVEHTRPGARTTTVTMSVADRGRPLHADATATIRPRIFLEGNFYVDLQPGTPQAPTLHEGGTIPAARTANPVQVDEVLKALKSDTRADLRRTLIELGRAQRAGAGRAFNRSLAYQPDAYYFSTLVSEALLGERDALIRYFRDAGTVAAAIDRTPPRLQALITDFNRTVAAFASRDAALRAGLGELPVTLREAMPTLAALNAAFPNVRRLAVAARPGVRSTGPAADALIPLLRQLRPLVSEAELRGLARDLRASTPALARLTNESIPLLEQLRLAASCATNVLVPWGNDTVPDAAHPASGPVHEEIPQSFTGLAGESRSFDANGQWFKVLGGGGAQTFDLGDGLFGTSLNPLIGVNPPPDTTRPPLRPDVPCETQQTPDLATIPLGPPRQVPIDPNDPQVLERTRRARAVAIALAKAALAAAGDTTTAVIESDLTPQAVKDIAHATGLEGQLSQLPPAVDAVNDAVPNP